MANSLDDILSSFPQLLPDPSKAAPGEAPPKQSLDDIFSSAASNPTGQFKAPGPLSPESESAGNAFTGGVGEGATAGYADRAYTPGEMDDLKAHPYIRAGGNLVGGILPGYGIAKGAKALGTGVDALSYLAKPGFWSGATQGAVVGGAQDTGPEKTWGDFAEDHLTNAAKGLGLGGILGRLSRTFGNAGDEADILDKLNGDDGNYSKQVKAQIDDASKKLMASQVTPRKDALGNLLSGKNVDVDSGEMNKLWERRATPRPGSAQLPPLEQILRGQGLEPMATSIPAEDAQSLKEYFDGRANYAKGKPFDPAAAASGDREKRVADYFRDRLSAIPGVDDLNHPMSENLKLNQAVTAPASTNPIGSITTSSPDKLQQLMDFDSKAGTNLAETGDLINGARSMQKFNWNDLFKSRNLAQPFHLAHMLGDAIDLSAGRTNQFARGVLPPGTVPSLTNTAVQLLNRKKAQ